MSAGGRIFASLLLRCGFCMLAAGAASGHAAGRLPELALPRAMVDQGWNGHMRLNGAEVAFRLFETPGTPGRIAAQVIEGFASGRPKPLLRPWPDGLALAGMDGDLLWSLQLRQVAQGRTRGLLTARAASASAPRPAYRPEWVPDGARLVFDLEEGEPGRGVLQQAYTQDSPLDDLTRQLRRRLAAAGWRPIQEGDAWSVWRKEAEQAQIVTLPQGRHSGFFLTIEERMP